ncbi:dimethylargininase [Salinibacterium hongtaonis]|uniref:Dimethylarginine dimethylaminohydrolase n=1 Tax=Homoserinimonas hongtaonis TaxID=2079791 RepID=A0A2U1T2L1_9MICO|nr:dimethylargininase [Salinibacterium hongtaonis]PWB98109.1 dimethylarginine dimethylaminohydrolase [Salinibacterium hongtaonis]
MAYPSSELSLARRILGALATGAAIALLAHVATVFAFFVAAGADPESLMSVGSFFLNGSLLAFVLFSLAAVLEAFRRWYIALPAALLAAALASFCGTMLTLIGQGATIDSAALSYLVTVLVGPNLVFIVASAIVGATVGVVVWRWVVRGSAPAATPHGTLLVRLPASTLAEGQVTHIDRLPVDPEEADREWDTYVEVFSDHGWKIVEIPVAEGLADSVFVEDNAVVIDDLAIIGVAGTPSREGESEAVETALRNHRLRIEHITAPGTLEGGDVLRVGSTVYVGSSSRTNAEGIRQLRALLSPRGFDVVAVPVSRALHLKSAVSALPDGTVLGYAPLLDQPGLFSRLLPVPEPEGAAVVALDSTTVLMSESAPQSAELVRSLGYTVFTTPISQFERLEGCVTCLSVRIP